jgi:DNA-directed RNA polymerase specialized sigma24 family protein
LPEKQRLAIAYRYAGDLSYEEIAEAMGSSKDSARQNVSTGLKSLRRVVKHV